MRGSGNGTPTLAQLKAQLRAERLASGKLHRRAQPKKQSVTDKVEHNLKVFPRKVSNFVKDLFN